MYICEPIICSCSLRQKNLHMNNILNKPTEKILIAIFFFKIKT